MKCRWSWKFLFDEIRLMTPERRIRSSGVGIQGKVEFPDKKTCFFSKIHQTVILFMCFYSAWTKDALKVNIWSNVWKKKDASECYHACLYSSSMVWIDLSNLNVFCHCIHFLFSLFGIIFIAIAAKFRNWMTTNSFSSHTDISCHETWLKATLLQR